MLVVLQCKATVLIGVNDDDALKTAEAQFTDRGGLETIMTLVSLVLATLSYNHQGTKPIRTIGLAFAARRTYPVLQ